MVDTFSTSELIPEGVMVIFVWYGLRQQMCNWLQALGLLGSDEFATNVLKWHGAIR